MFCTTQPTSATGKCDSVVVGDRDGSPSTVEAVDVLVKAPVGVHVANVKGDNGSRPGIELGSDASKNLKAIGGKACPLLRERPKQAFIAAEVGTGAKAHYKGVGICQIRQGLAANPMADAPIILTDSAFESQHCAG